MRLPGAVVKTGTAGSGRLPRLLPGPARRPRPATVTVDGQFDDRKAPKTFTVTEVSPSGRRRGPLAAATFLVAAAWCPAARPRRGGRRAAAATGVTVVVDPNEPRRRRAGRVRPRRRRRPGLRPLRGGRLPAHATPRPARLRVPGHRRARRPTRAQPPPADAYWGLWWSDGTNGHVDLLQPRRRLADACPTAATSPSPGTRAGQRAAVVRPGAAHAAPSSSPSPPRRPPQPGPPTAPPADGRTPTAAPPSRRHGRPGPAAQRDPERRRPRHADPVGHARAPGDRVRDADPERHHRPTRRPSGGPDPRRHARPTRPHRPRRPGRADRRPTATDDGGLPGWLAPLVIVLLFALAGVVLLLQRRRAQDAP